MLDLPAARKTLLDVAERFGTPTYVYAEAVVRRQAARLRALFDGLPARLLYAMKANSAPALLAILRDEGLGVDAVSPGELALALRLGFAPECVLFSANMITDAEMHAAHAAGVLVNVGEVSRLERFGRAFPGADVCVRLNPGGGAGHHAHVVTAGATTKFGVSVDEIPAALAVARRHGLRVVGVHQHIGSGILDAGSFAASTEAMLAQAAAFPDARFFNFGGGLGIPYHPDEAEIDVAAFRARVVAPLERFVAARPGVELYFEPGRYLVAQAGALLARVTTLKTNAGRTFAGTDTGMNHLVRPTVYGAYHGVANLSDPDGPPRTYTVTGNVCETGDVLAPDRLVPELREGDVVAFLDAGAYGMSMASTYNLRPLPAEVLIGANGEARILRERQTPDALVDALLGEHAPTA